jgi:hypothetical protein
MLATRKGDAPSPPPAVPAASPSTAPNPAAASAAPSVENAANSWATTDDLPPAWVERGFVIDQGNVYVVGHGESTAADEGSISAVRADAITKLVRQIYGELSGAPVHAFVQARLHDEGKDKSDAIVARFLGQVGATATPERVEFARRKKGAGIESYGRYKLTKAAYDLAISQYRETATFQGMTVARFFPLLENSLHSNGDLIVIAVSKGQTAEVSGVRAGDVVLQVDARGVSGVEAFNKAAAEAWAHVPGGGTLSVLLESGGARTTSKFFKPMPRP